MQNPSQQQDSVSFPKSQSASLCFVEGPTSKVSLTKNPPRGRKRTDMIFLSHRRRARRLGGQEPMTVTQNLGACYSSCLRVTWHRRWRRMPASLLPPYFFQADAVPRNVFNIPPGTVCAAVIHKDPRQSTTEQRGPMLSPRCESEKGRIGASHANRHVVRVQCTGP